MAGGWDGETAPVPTGTVVVAELPAAVVEEELVTTGAAVVVVEEEATAVVELVLEVADAVLIV